MFLNMCAQVCRNDVGQIQIVLKTPRDKSSSKLTQNKKVCYVANFVLLKMQNC